MQLVIIITVTFLLSGCALIQDKSVKNDSGNVRVSGDVTISSVERKGL